MGVPGGRVIGVPGVMAVNIATSPTYHSLPVKMTIHGNACAG